MTAIWELAARELQLLLHADHHNQNLMKDDMNNLKRFFCLLTLVLLSFALLAGCGSQDGDWQDTDEIIYEYDSIGAGSIMRNGEQIEVLFFYDQETVYIYYNDYFYDLKEPKLLDKAELPTYELHDTDWCAESFYTGDDNGV